ELAVATARRGWATAEDVLNTRPLDAVLSHHARCADASAPAEGGRDVLHDALDDVGVVLDAELAGHGEQQRVRGGDRLVLRELGDQRVWFRGVGAAEDRARPLVDVADVVALAASGAEVAAVHVAHESEDAAADRDAWLPLVPRLLPCVPERLDVPRLDDVERIAARVVEDQGGAHQVHAEPGGPGRGLRRRGAPPDPVAQARRARLEPEQSRRGGGK